jgi:hypothetical protein
LRREQRHLSVGPIACHRGLCVEAWQSRLEHLDDLDAHQVRQYGRLIVIFIGHVGKRLIAAANGLELICSKLCEAARANKLADSKLGPQWRQRLVFVAEHELALGNVLAHQRVKALLRAPRRALRELTLIDAHDERIVVGGEELKLPGIVLVLV